MKGTITTCLAEMVEKKHGSAAWAQIVEEAEVDPKTARHLLLPVSDIDDAVVGRLLSATCSVLGVTLEQAADAFGEYWCCTYAPKVYKPVVDKLKSARQAILALDGIHVRMTSMMENASPPRFDYAEIDERTVEVTYKSKRNLLPIYVGLAKGLGKYFRETVAVTVIDRDRVRLEFGAAK